MIRFHPLALLLGVGACSCGNIPPTHLAADAGASEDASWAPPRFDDPRPAPDPAALELVLDINATPRAVGAHHYILHGDQIVFGAQGGDGYALFSVRDDDAPRELARVDSWSSVPLPVASWNGTLLFAVQDTLIGNELWRYRDGELVPFDVAPGLRSGWSADIGPLGTDYLFIAATEAGRRVVRLRGHGGVEIFSAVEIAHTSFGRQPFAIFGDRLVFASQGGSDGGELWISDGTPTGTRLVRDICPGACGSNVAALTPLGDRLFFVADDGEHGLEPWITDGTTAGTTLIRELSPGPTSGVNNVTTHTIEHRGKVFFSGNDGDHGLELWETDGTAAGTRMVADLRPGPTASSPAQFLSHGETLLFAALAESGARALHVLSDRGGVASLEATTIGAPVIAGGVVYFPGQDPEHGRELWRTDGTTSGTRRVVDLAPGAADGVPISLQAIGDHVYFAGNDARHPTGSPFRSDGSAEGTRALGLLSGAATGPAFHTGIALAVVGERAFFAASDGRHGRELWSWEPGHLPALVRDVRAGMADAITNLTVVAAGDHVFFVADDGAHGAELWMSDGTERGTRMVADLNPGSAGSSPSGLVWTGTRLIFIADDGSDVGREPYVAQGFPPEVRLLADLDPTPRNIGSSGPQLVVDGELYVNLRDERGPGVFHTRGNGSPVRLTPTNLFANTIGRIGRAVYLSCNHGIGSPPGGTPGLYRTDGTPEGTVHIRRIFPSQFFELGETLAFVAGSSLYTFDGETGASIEEVVALGIVGPVSVLNGAAYFFGGDAEHGLGLFRSDLTPGGLQLVRRLGVASTFSARDVPLAVSDGYLYFAASDGLSGVELFRSDGTPDGTQLYFDILPGPRGSQPRWAGAVAGRRVWMADDGVRGLELWATPPSR